ncbi:MAG: glycosyltransferase [Cyclobacteriaceae bacterium]|nr:glycosyltransferase [Cyclobacteriaceae bacterium]UYN88611.1 MAG: glycosyltransferase [Cyclobacteriaceae bacterium]
MVCAHDEEGNLRELLPKLLSQNHPHYEVVIVDDRSNDGTFDFLRETAEHDKRLRIVKVEHLPNHANGKKYGLTLGIKAAHYDIILLTDADCRPAGENWLQSMAGCFQDKTQFVLGYSPYQKLGGLLNLFIRYETIVTGIQYLSFALMGNPYMGVGRNLAYRKSLFLQNKGFNEYLGITGGDDDLFVNKHARGETTVACIDPSSITVSKPKQTWSEFVQQKIRHLSVGKYYRFKHRVVLGLFSLTHILSWFLAAVLVYLQPYFWWVPAAVVLRLFIVSGTVYSFSKRVGHKFDVWAVPLLDFLFAIYYISTGTVALVTKKVQWKN